LVRPYNNELGFTVDLLPLYLRFFNFMVRRVVAVAFVVVGSLGALLSIPAIFIPNGSVLVNGVAQGSLFWRILAVVFPGVFAILGVVLFRARPFVLRQPLVKPNKSLERTHEE
jgi:hypothetical protein